MWKNAGMNNQRMREIIEKCMRGLPIPYGERMVSEERLAEMRKKLLDLDPCVTEAVKTAVKETRSEAKEKAKKKRAEEAAFAKRVIGLLDLPTNDSMGGRICRREERRALREEAERISNEDNKK